MITIFRKEEEKYFLTFVLKYDNDFETILGEMKKGAKINYEEVEKYMKDVEEKYVILFSNDYPEYFRNFSQPPFALFYEGNLELFNNNEQLLKILWIQQKISIWQYQKMVEMKWTGVLRSLMKKTFCQ